ncbi:MAG: universal stress protein [Desulfuromonas sp.]|nr:MAG: universal stress protein [Desulfuromonas sp.]
MTTRILLPLDDSPTADRTIQELIAQRERYPIPITVLHVVNTERLTYHAIPDFQLEMIREKAAKAGEQMLTSRCQELSDAGLQVIPRLEFGSPRQIVCKVANEEKFELIILGRRRAGEIRDVLFGSVSNYALHHVHCPVLLF